MNTCPNCGNESAPYSLCPSCLKEQQEVNAADWEEQMIAANNWCFDCKVPADNCLCK